MPAAVTHPCCVFARWPGWQWQSPPPQQHPKAAPRAGVPRPGSSGGPRPPAGVLGMTVRQGDSDSATWQYPQGWERAWVLSIFGGAGPLILGENRAVPPQLCPAVTLSHPRGQASSEGVAYAGDRVWVGLSPGSPLRVLLCRREIRLEGPPRPQGRRGRTGTLGNSWSEGSSRATR